MTMNAKFNAEELDLLQSNATPNNNYKELEELELEDYVGAPNYRQKVWWGDKRFVGLFFGYE